MNPKSLPSITKEVQRRSFKGALKASLVLFVLISAILFLNQINEKHQAIEKKLEIDSEFLVNALKLGDLFFITRFNAAFVDSEMVSGIGIKQVDSDDWLSVTGSLEGMNSSYKAKSFELTMVQTEFSQTKVLENDGQSAWQIRYVYSISHAIFLWSFMYAVLISFIIFLIVMKVLSASSDFFVKPVENISMDLKKDNLDEGRTLSFKSYAKGPRFLETEQFVEELKSLIEKIKEQEEKVKKTEILEALNKMSRQVDHDVQSPLGALKVAIENLGNNPQKASELIIKSVQRIQEIVSDLKVENPLISERVNLENVELNSFMRNLAEEKKAEYQGRSLSINVVSENKEVLVQADKSQLSRAFSNLINNSIEAVDDGKDPKVEIEIQSVGKALKISVSDNGCGIAEENLEKVFQYGTSIGKSQGSGTGLAYASQVLSNLGLVTRIKSKLGQGTTVYIET